MIRSSILHASASRMRCRTDGFAIGGIHALFCIVVRITGGYEIGEARSITPFIYSYVVPKLLGFYSKGLLPPLLRLRAQSGRPPARLPPLRAGGLFCCFFPAFSLLGVTMGWGPFWQCRRFGSSHSLASCRPRSSRFFLRPVSENQTTAPIGAEDRNPHSTES